MAEDSTLSSASDNTTQWMKNPYEIQYGWCYTDHKDGKELRPKYRNVDYVQDKKYAESVAAMLKKMGLPQPRIQQVYRGTHHDLLFLDDHGVVVRIGPTNINDLIHPAIIQPLGWIDDKENEITVAIYPGVELIKNVRNPAFAEMKLHNIKAGLRRAGHETYDVNKNNAGMSYVERDGVGVPVAILLDPDNNYNGAASTGDLGDALTRIRESVQRSGAAANKSDMLDDAIGSISALAQDMKDWETFFRSHQPLRTRFWLSQKGRENSDTPDPEYMKMFWDECRSLKQKPKSYIQHKYTSYVNESGLSVYRYTRYEIKNASLLSPWTRKDDDQYVRRPVAEHKRKIFAEIAADASAYERQHDFYKGSTKFAMQALNINLGCYQYLSAAQKALPEIGLLRLNRAFFLGEELGPVIADFDDALLKNDEIQRYIMALVDDYQLELDEIPAVLADDPAFALKALPRYPYSFQQIINDKPYAQQRDFILNAVKISADAAEHFVFTFDNNPDLLWECVRINVKFNNVLKYCIKFWMDEIPDDLQRNVDFVNRFIQCNDFDRHGYEILKCVHASVAKDNTFKAFVRERLKDVPEDARYLPDVLLQDQKYMLSILRAEPKVFFSLSREMRENEVLARAALYADYKRKVGVCNEVPPKLVDELYDGDDKKFKKYFFELCSVYEVVFSTLPAKYAEDKVFILNVLDYGATNFFQLSQALRDDHDVAAKSILSDLDANGAHVTPYLSDALCRDEAFITGLLTRNEDSYICFPDFLVDNPQHMPDKLRENSEYLYALAQISEDGRDMLTRIFALSDTVLTEDVKMALSCHLAYQHHWSRDIVPDHFLYDRGHVIDLLNIDAEIYHELPEGVQSEPSVMEAALLNDDSYDMGVMASIPKDVLSGFSIWQNTAYLEALGSAIAQNKAIYAHLPPAMQNNKNLIQGVVEKNSDIYKDLSYDMKAEKGIIYAALGASLMNVMGVIGVITSSLEDAAFNDLDIWFDAGLQERIQVQLQKEPTNFWTLPPCLQENKPFLSTALAANINVFERFTPPMQQDSDVLRAYFDALGAIPEAARPDNPVFLPNVLHHDHDFMSDVFARIGFDKAYLPSVLAKDKAFFDQAVLKSPKLLDDDDFMMYFNAAQYQRSLEDMADPEKWFNNHLVDAFNTELHKALEECAQQYDRVVKREDGLAYEWVANVCPNKVEEQDGRILYNYAGQDNAAPLVYEAAIIGDAANVKALAKQGQIGIYKLLPE